MNAQQQKQIEALAFLQAGANDDSKKLKQGGIAGAVLGLAAWGLMVADGVPLWFVIVMSASGFLLAGICLPLAKLANVSPVLGHLRTVDDPIVKATLAISVFKTIPRLNVRLVTNAGVQFDEAVILSERMSVVEEKANAATESMRGAIEYVERVE